MAGVVGADVEWGNLHVAGAFLLGAIVATIATLRVVKAVTNFFAHVKRDDDQSSSSS